MSRLIPVFLALAAGALGAPRTGSGGGSWTPPTVTTTLTSQGTGSASGSGGSSGRFTSTSSVTITSTVTASTSVASTATTRPSTASTVPATTRSSSVPVAPGSGGSGSGSGSGSSAAHAKDACPGLPGSERMVFAILAIPGLVFAMTAHKFIKVALFTVASVVVAYLCYVFSPLALGSTAVYHNPYGRPVLSAVVGLIFGGLLSLKLLRIGIFCMGGVLGLLFGMLAMFSPLQQESFFQQPYAFDIYYGSCVFVFGTIAVCLEKKSLIFATSLVGSFIFILGLDYFIHSGFSQIIETALVGARSQLARQVLHKGTPGDDVLCHRAPQDKAYYMLAGWIVLAFVSMAVQGQLDRKAKEGDEESQPRRRQRRTRRQLDDDEAFYQADDLDMSGWTESRRRVHNKYRNGGPATRRERRRDREMDEAPLMPQPRGNQYVEQANRRQGNAGPSIFINLNQGHGLPLGHDEDSHM